MNYEVMGNVAVRRYISILNFHFSYLYKVTILVSVPAADFEVLKKSYRSKIITSSTAVSAVRQYAAVWEQTG